MEKSELLSPDIISSGQELIKSKIFERAKKLELSNDSLEPLPDGVADIEGSKDSVRATSTKCRMKREMVHQMSSDILGYISHHRSRYS